MSVNSVKEFLRDQLLEKIEQLTVFNEIAAWVASGQELDTILRSVLSLVHRLIPYEYSEVIILNGDKRRLRHYHYCHASNTFEPHVHPDDDRASAVQWVITEGAPRLLREIDEASPYCEDRELRERGMRSAIFLPIRSGGDLHGCLVLADKRRERFNVMHEHTLEHICCQIATAVRHASLFDELQSTRDHLVGLIENAGEAIVAVDRDLVINTWNQRADSIFGEDQAAALDVPLQVTERSEAEETNLRALFQRAMEQAEIQRVNARRVLPDGGIMHLDISVTPVSDEGGQLIGALSVSRDVTDNFMLQDQLLQTKKLATMGELISGITHELNNKLAPILGYAQLIHRRLGDEDPRVRGMLTKIEDAALSAKKVVESLLAFARPQKKRLEEMDLNEVVQTTLELVRFQIDKEDIAIRLDLGSDLPTTVADSHQVSQVILNLVNNAVHAMRSVDHRLLTIHTSRVNGYLRLRVADTGTGIPPDVMERIFDPFFSTKQVGEGTGLGLSVSFGIIQAHSGRIKVENRPDGGASFTVELPVTRGVNRKPKQEQPAILEADSEPFSHILVVDDDPFLRELLRDIFKRDHEIQTADSGYEAIQLLKDRDFDAVILDLRMPGMNGMDLFEWLRKEREHLVDNVIFITGDTFDSKTDRFLKDSKRPYLGKPFQIPELKGMVRQVIQENGVPLAAEG